MKNLNIYFCFFLFSLHLSAQEHQLQLNVQLEGLRDDEIIYLSVSDGNVARQVDTLYLKDNKLSFNYTLPYIPNQIYLGIPERNLSMSFWAENKSMELKGKLSDWEHIQVLGSDYQALAHAFEQSFNEDSDDSSKLEQIRQFLPAPNALGELYWIKEKVSTNILQDIIQELPQALKEHDLGQRLINFIQAKELGFVQKSEPYIDFKGVNTSGQLFQLSKQVGEKFILLEFRSAYCMPSLKNIPELQKLHKKYAQELEIITISTDTSPLSWEDMKTEEGILWNQVWDEVGQVGLTGQRYKIDGSPYLFLISPDGTILEKWFGYAKGLVEQQWLKHRP